MRHQVLFLIWLRRSPIMRLPKASVTSTCFCADATATASINTRPISISFAAQVFDISIDFLLYLFELCKIKCYNADEIRVGILRGGRRGPVGWPSMGAGPRGYGMRQDEWWRQKCRKGFKEKWNMRLSILLPLHVTLSSVCCTQPTFGHNQSQHVTAAHRTGRHSTSPEARTEPYSR